MGSTVVRYSKNKQIKLIEFTGQILVPSLAAENAATYSQSGTTITVTSTGHNIPATTYDGAIVYLAIGDVSTGVAPEALYANHFTNFQYVNADSFTCQATNSQTGTGTVNTNTSNTTLLPLSTTLLANTASTGDFFSMAGAFTNNNSANSKAAHFVCYGTSFMSATATTALSTAMNIYNGAYIASGNIVIRQTIPSTPVYRDFTADLPLTIYVKLNAANEFICLEGINVRLNKVG